MHTRVLGPAGRARAAAAGRGEVEAGGGGDREAQEPRHPPRARGAGVGADGGKLVSPAGGGLGDEGRWHGQGEGTTFVWWQNFNCHKEKRPYNPPPTLSG